MQKSRLAYCLDLLTAGEVFSLPRLLCVCLFLSVGLVNVALYLRIHVVISDASSLFCLGAC